MKGECLEQSHSQLRDCNTQEQTTTWEVHVEENSLLHLRDILCVMDGPNEGCGPTRNMTFSSVDSDAHPFELTLLIASLIFSLGSLQVCRIDPSQNETGVMPP